MHTCTRWDFVSFQLVLPLSLSSSISCASWWVLALLTDVQAHFDNCEQCTCRRGLVYALPYVGSFNTVCPSVVSCILYQSSGTSWSKMPHCLACQDTSFLSLIYFFDQILVCSFWGGRSWLDFFLLGFVYMNCHYCKSNNYQCGEINNSRLHHHSK